MAHHKKTHKFIEFYFVYNRFVGGDMAWKSHCQEHIDRHETPLRCNFLRFHHAIACPGRCLICMHNK
ncbi:hypothetical protein F5B19DRAFT_481094 [Rostrohypoxylon terebratum]|nr:hypothetical protein F5B19DRAFT_481094 [Rostrohypoxylon terebratum]